MFKTGDYHLQPISPCIDTGDNSAADLPATDIDGLPRIIDGDNNSSATVDMGADEQSDGVELILRAIALSSNHIMLEWFVLDPGPVTSYVLYRNGVRIATLTATGSSSVRYSDVIGVEPGTDYQYEVAALNGASEPPRSVPVNVNSGPDPETFLPVFPEARGYGAGPRRGAGVPYTILKNLQTGHGRKEIIQPSRKTRCVNAWKPLARGYACLKFRGTLT